MTTSRPWVSENCSIKTVQVALRKFEEPKNFGSLIRLAWNERSLALLRDAIEAKDLGASLFLRETQPQSPCACSQQAEAAHPAVSRRRGQSPLWVRRDEFQRENLF